VDLRDLLLRKGKGEVEEAREKGRRGEGNGRGIKGGGEGKRDQLDSSPILAQDVIFREYSRNVEVPFRYFP